MPSDTFRGPVWVGELTDEQLAEVISRVRYYLTFVGTDDYRNCPEIVDAAVRVHRVLQKRGAWA